MLLHPLEKHLYFPSLLIKECNLSGIKVHVVGQENKVHHLCPGLLLWEIPKRGRYNPGVYTSLTG